MRREVAALDANLPPHEIQPLTENVALALWSARTGAAVLSIFGLLGLALAAIGVYGVISHTVARRTREIGVRMALGAQSRDVLKLIMGRGLVLALTGVAIGLTLSVAVTRWLESLLYGVSATDATTAAGVSLLLVCVALVACYIPARRAMKVDPLAALRHEWLRHVPPIPPCFDGTPACLAGIQMDYGPELERPPQKNAEETQSGKIERI
jgi:putative ABC transport system permease protein